MENARGKYKFWDFKEKKHIWSDEVLQMSATDISACKECEWKFYYKLTQEFKPPKNVYLIMGSVFHSVIEEDLRHFVKFGRHYTLSDIDRVFKNSWEKEKKGVESFGKFTEYQAREKCRMYILTYFIKESPLLYPLNNECIEKFFNIFITFGERRLGITGKVDLIDKSMWINDHKTSSSPWTQKDADEEIQGQLYPFCMRNLGYKIQGFRFNVVSGDYVNVFKVDYDQAKVKEILTYAFDIKRKIEEGNILRARSEKVCKFCSYLGICKESLIRKEECL